MRKLTLLLLFMIMASNIIFAQKYHKFIEPNKQWFVAYKCDGPCGYYNYRYIVECDTIINSVVYKKIVSIDNSGLSSIVSQLSAILREDTINQKVYSYVFRKEDTFFGKELLLYNFKALAGDSIDVYYYPEPILYGFNMQCKKSSVKSVDSTYLKNNEVVKVIMYDSYNFIEGIGGGFNFFAPKPSPFGLGAKIIGVKLKSTMIYGDSISHLPPYDEYTGSPYLTTSTSSLELEASSNINTSFAISTDFGWKIECYSDWVTFSSVKGFGNTTINVTAQPNPTDTVRVCHANIYSNAISCPEAQITITQKANSAGIKINESTQISIFCNSTNTILFISGLTQKTTVEIVDLSGKILLKKQIANDEINISNLTYGIYLVRIFTKRGIELKKIIKVE